MSFFNRYPYTDFHELNLDWILDQIRKLHEDWDEFTAVNTITNAGAWDITKQYQAWTIVSDNNAGYISLKPVPAGVAITNTEYWGFIADYNILITDLTQRISDLEAAVVTINNDIDNIEGDVLTIQNDISTIETWHENGMVNVKDFGATGDGTTDDSAAFANAITYANDNGVRAIFIPSGSYKVGTITLPAGFAKISLLGENTASTRLLFTDSIGIELYEGSGGLVNTDIKNLTIGPFTDILSAGTIGIHCVNCCGVNIEEVYIAKFDKGILCSNRNTGFTEHVIADKTVFLGCNYAMYFTSQAGATEVSYHGCGMRACCITDPHENAVYIDQDCFLYNSVMDFTVWCNGDKPIISFNPGAASSNITKSLLTEGCIRYECNQAPKIFADNGNANVIAFAGKIIGIGGTDEYDLGNGFIVDSANMLSDASVQMYNARARRRYTAPAAGSNIYYIRPGMHLIYYSISAANLFETGYFYALNDFVGKDITGKTEIRRQAPTGITITFTIGSGSGTLRYSLSNGADLNGMVINDIIVS